MSIIPERDVNIKGYTMKKTLLWLSLIGASLFSSAYANNAAIEKSLAKMGITVEEVRNSPIKDVKMVLTNEGVLYTSEDGRYVFQTAIYDISGSVPKNTTISTLSAKIDEISDEMIIYKADKEEHVVTIFTDPTCLYCIKLHKSIPEYNKLGITVRYLAFAREGLQSKSADEIQDVWCSSDQKQAFVEASKGNKVTHTNCKIDTSTHYNLGLQMGIQGTPAIVYKQMILPGFVEPTQLKAMLKNFDKQP